MLNITVLRAIYVMVVGLCCLVSQVAHANVLATWQHTPIEVLLPLQQERIVRFPLPLTVGVSRTLLQDGSLTLQNNDQTIYFTAHKSFDHQRVQVRLANGQVVLLTLSTRSDAPLETLEILVPNVVASEFRGSSTSSEANNAMKAATTPSVVEMLRFVIQTLYAPNELLERPALLQRYPLAVAHLVPLLPDQPVLAMPLASWTVAGQFVTAVQITNLRTQALRLAPDTVCGDWQAFAVYPRTELSPHASANATDTTTVLLVSGVPFAAALKTCLLA